MEETIEELINKYNELKKKNISLNLERGWPCQEQLELSEPMLDMVDSSTNLLREVDYRNYGGTGGISPMKKIFCDILDVAEEELYVGGTMSTTIMYDIICKAVMFGIRENKPWKELEKVKFICPSPGYEKHFKICENFGIEMIPVPLTGKGPDMDYVEKIVMNDEYVKGIWCVPIYSNPTGDIYSDEVIVRLAKMKTKSTDFYIFWDNAYCMHHLTEKKYKIKNIIRECEKAHNPDRVFEFTSTSKITFPGAGVAACASSRDNIKWLEKNMLLQLKTGDKINQLRHALFLKNRAGIEAHMKKHAEILLPKFELIDNMLNKEFSESEMIEWSMPKGGYFINIKLKEHMASKVWNLCKELGVRFTPPGSTFPYNNDPNDQFIRLAPTYCSLGELEIAMEIFILAVKLAKLDVVF